MDDEYEVTKPGYAAEKKKKYVDPNASDINKGLAGKGTQAAADDAGAPKREDFPAGLAGVGASRGEEG